MDALCETHSAERPPSARGKVRDIYDLGSELVIVATDRISAFDWVNPVGIPDKGRILTQLSLFWFDQLRNVCPNHLISSDLADFPPEFQARPEMFAGRSMRVRKCAMLPIECVVRGYLAGSGWAEYRKSQSVCGIALPDGLVESSKLPEPIFTPATKAETGHDINISYAEAEALVDSEVLAEAARLSLTLYQHAHDYAEARGIILCDTKFEFGLIDGQLILADEVLTPDSSRFWPAKGYLPGRSQPSYDKQFVRDWLEVSGWDKNSPPPPLPDKVVERTRQKYVDAYRALTGQDDF